MPHKEVLYGWFILITLLFVAILFISNPLSSPTGYAVSLLANPEVSAEKTWDFLNSSDYTYNSSAISVNGSAQLALIPTTTSTTINEVNETPLLSAVKYEDDDTEDKTSKVNTIGQGKVQLNEGEVVLEVKLGQEMQDNDLLSLYLLKGTAAGGKIYLCTDSSGCSAGEYGNRTLPGTVAEGWYNVTLSGIPAAHDTFFLDSPDKIEIDMVKGYYKSTRTETTAVTSYPSSASIQTEDFQPADWKNWGALSKEEQLNGQTVNYYYSTDSGSTWTALPAGGNLSAVTGSMIQLKAELSSNTSSTPIIDTLTLAYSTQVPCTESWAEQYGSCLKDDTRLKYYTDSNGCGTTSSLPADNNTYVSCDYCALSNCSGSARQKPVAETRGNKTVYMVDAKDAANTKLEIEAENPPASVEMVEYAHNIKNETPSSTAVNRYVEIESAAAAISSVKIIIYYNDSEIATIDENTLKIYYYNESSKVWDALESTVNASGNYVSAVVPHLSWYGLFGQEASSDAGSSASSSAGGGGSGRRNTEIAAPASDDSAVEIAETILPTRSELESNAELTAPISETSCEYVVEMSLPEEVVLGEDESYEGEIANKGNCEIPRLKLDLSPELQEVVTSPARYFESLAPGNKTNFVLIRIQQQGGLFGATSYVVGTLLKRKVSGMVIIEGQDQQQALFRRELPLEVILEPRFPGDEAVSLVIILLTLATISTGMFFRRKKEKKKFSSSKRKRIHP